MTRYERKLFFEQLVALRAAYGAEAHQAISMTIEDAITFAAVTFDALVDADEATAATISAAITTTGSSRAG